MYTQDHKCEHTDVRTHMHTRHVHMCPPTRSHVNTHGGTHAHTCTGTHVCTCPRPAFVADPNSLGTVVLRRSQVCWLVHAARARAGLALRPRGGRGGRRRGAGFLSERCRCCGCSGAGPGSGSEGRQSCNRWRGRGLPVAGAAETKARGCGGRTGRGNAGRGGWRARHAADGAPGPGQVCGLRAQPRSWLGLDLQLGRGGGEEGLEGAGSREARSLTGQAP